MCGYKTIDETVRDPLSFLKIKSIFGNLADTKSFTNTYLVLISRLRTNGIRRTIEDVMSNELLTK
jgi:hypothetical protein